MGWLMVNVGGGVMADTGVFHSYHRNDTRGRAKMIWGILIWPLPLGPLSRFPKRGSVTVIPRFREMHRISTQYKKVSNIGD